MSRHNIQLSMYGLCTVLWGQLINKISFLSKEKWTCASVTCIKLCFLKHQNTSWRGFGPKCFKLQHVNICKWLWHLKTRNNRKQQQRSTGFTHTRTHSDLLTIPKATTKSSDVAFALTLCLLKNKDLAIITLFDYRLRRRKTKKELQTKFS